MRAWIYRIAVSVLLAAQPFVAAADGVDGEVERLGMQALKLSSQGKYPEALQLAQQTQKLAESELGKEHPRTLETLHTLGLIYSILLTATPRWNPFIGAC